MILRLLISRTRHAASPSPSDIVPLTAPAHDGAQAAPRPRLRPIVIINTFTAKPEKAGRIHRPAGRGAAPLRGSDSRLRGSRMHRSLDGETAVLITAFDTMDDQKNWLATELFAQHRAQILPLIEQASPKAFEIIYEAGEI